MVVLHVVLVLRIGVGLMGSREIRSLRDRGARLDFESDWRPIRSRGQYVLNILVDGTIGRGRSNADVFSIELTGANEFSSGCTDEEIKFIASHFPNLKRLWISHSPVSSAGLKPLLNCQRLQELGLGDTDINDDAIEILAGLKNLQVLSLVGTLVSDRTLEALQKSPALVNINVAYTDVSLEAIHSFRQQAGTRTISVTSILDKQPESMIGVIRWSDGSRSGRFAGDFEICLEGPLKQRESPDLYVFDHEELRRHNLWWDVQHFEVGEWHREWQYYGFNARGPGMTVKNTTIQLADGEYRVMLKLGQVQSESVNFQIQDGRPATHLLEFQMPCARAEASLPP